MDIILTTKAAKDNVNSPRGLLGWVSATYPSSTFMFAVAEQEKDSVLVMLSSGVPEEEVGRIANSFINRAEKNKTLDAVNNFHSFEGDVAKFFEVVGKNHKGNSRPVILKRNYNKQDA